VNRRFSLLALAPLLVLPSCSAFKLSEKGGPSSRNSFGRPSVAEGRGFYVSAQEKLAGSPAVVATPAPAPAVIPQPAPIVVNPVEKVQTASTPEPVKPADKPAVTKRRSDQDADQLRLPGDLLNQPAEKDYKPSNSNNGDAPVIAKPPGAR